MNEHPVIFWLIIADLVLSGLWTFYRGAAQKTITYAPAEGFLGLFEVALIMWGFLILTGAL